MARYENYRLNALIQETLAKDKRSASGTALQQMPDMEMPPIYVSIPDPNHVRVEICAYDRAAHKSDWIEVRSGASMALYGGKSSKVTQELKQYNLGLAHLCAQTRFSLDAGGARIELTHSNTYYYHFGAFGAPRWWPCPTRLARQPVADYPTKLTGAKRKTRT